MTHEHIDEQMDAQRYVSLGLAGLHVCLCYVSHRRRLHRDSKRRGHPTGEPCIYVILFNYLFNVWTIYRPTKKRLRNTVVFLSKWQIALHYVASVCLR